MSLSKRVIPDSVLEGCHALLPGVAPPYGYIPSLAAGIVFDILFLGFTALNLYRSIRYKVWSSYLLTICAVGELIGWIGRTWSSQCPYNSQAFPMQEICLVIAPVFLAATLYLYLGIFIRLSGDKFSLINPKLYVRIFLTSDIISLLVQAAGAGIATGEINSEGGNAWTGVYIVVGGLVFQGCRVPRNDAFVTITAISVLAVYIRCIYRTVQLAEGLAGYLSTHEGYFIALDAVMIVVAYIGFVFYDPGLLEDES
ncbi:conserved hypothetical protein [Talaromyces stipitatus ATCC 10500]|uniref:RTA1 domain protein n=1 Tax=Talaromyces stipitatus (strain ATCC 10500 / CBS 375.48 / QM 6759 / NRRL 1006) TaxID=441959 RepID=B8M884_TALSN|nr:uncharacterized protein TSTA_036230 [Talaromyces stipitatus ATCC 10500]EED20397.1 conserved hypothetical protein [Talaromyces stipitatus ATCC 10500]